MKLQHFEPVPAPAPPLAQYTLAFEHCITSVCGDDESPIVYRFAEASQVAAFIAGHWPVREDEWP